MSNIVPFDYSGDAIRVVWANGEPWFVGSDVARVLGYSNTEKAVREHVPDKWKKRASEMGGLRGQLHPDTVMISEAGLNRLIMRSTLPSAEAFQEWVCEVVLPTVRKTGKFDLSGIRLNQLVQVEPNLVTKLYEAEFRNMAKKIGMRESDLYIYIYKRLHPEGTFQALDKLAPKKWQPGAGRYRRVISGTNKQVMLYRFLTELGIEHNKYQQGKLSTIMQLVQTRQQFDEMCETVFGSKAISS